MLIGLSSGFPIRITDYAMQLADSRYLVMRKSRLAHQAIDLLPRVEEDIAAAQREPRLAHGRAPGPEARKRGDDLVGRDLAHLLQHGQRVADVIEKPYAYRHVEFIVWRELEQVRMNEAAAVFEVLFSRRLAAEVDHVFCDVQPCNIHRSFARQPQTVKPVAAADIEESAAIVRSAVFNREDVTLVHVLAKNSI